MFVLEQHEDLRQKIKTREYTDRVFAEKIIRSYSSILPDCGFVRSQLGKLSVAPYEWISNPLVQNKIKDLALSQYNAGGSDRAIEKIESINDINELKEWLKNKVKSDIEFGIQIIDS